MPLCFSIDPRRQGLAVRLANIKNRHPSKAENRCTLSLDSIAAFLFDCLRARCQDDRTCLFAFAHGTFYIEPGAESPGIAATVQCCDKLIAPAPFTGRPIV